MDPSNDIRDEFDDAVGSPDIRASFFFSRGYPGAPNPVLQLADIGTIGLPLGERDAQALKSRCVQARLWKEERNIADTNVGGVWEMDASLISFVNAQWTPFVDKLVVEVCTGLGVDVAASDSRAELYKLLLYETGSHLHPHRDTETSDGTFATIMIILPSLFTGGEVHLSHGVLPPKVIDCSPSSLNQTTVLSWYTDVTHEIKPITGGYRLALSYNLIHTNPGSLPPSMPSNDSTIEKIRHVLLSWNQKVRSNEEGTPTKLIYLLEGRYDQDDLNERTKDARGRSDEESDEDKLSLSIIGLVDLDGREIRETFLDGEEESEMEKRGECIPPELKDLVIDDADDVQEWVEHRPSARTLERRCRRTVFVIWPDHYHFQVAHSPDNERYALRELEDAIFASRRPGPRERRLIEYILSCVTRGSMSEEGVFGGLCTATCHWRDLEYWKIAVDACRAGQSLVILKPALIFRSIETFGFEIVRPTVEDALRNEGSNALRYNFLWQNEDRVRRRSLDPNWESWIDKQRHIFVKTLKAPSDADRPHLIQLAMEEGGTAFLTQILLPQIQTLGDPDFKMQFAVSLYSEKVKFTGTDENWRALESVIEELLLAAIASVDLFKLPDTPQQTVSYLLGRKEPKPGPDIAFGCFDKCLQTGNGALVGALVERLVESNGLAPASMQSRASHVLLPLITRIQSHLKSTNIAASSVSGLEKLCHIAAAWSMAHLDQLDWASREQELKNVVKAVVFSFQSHALLTNVVVPKLNTLQMSDNGGLVRGFVEELHARRVEVQPGSHSDGIASVVTELVNTICKRATLQTPRSIVDLLDFCLKTDNGGSCELVIWRALDPSIVTDVYISQVLVPLIPEIRRLLIKYHIPLATPRTLFSVLLRSTMLVWIEKVMGQKPSDEPSATALASLPNWTCRCEWCLRVKRFLTSSSDRDVLLDRLGFTMLRHVEDELHRYARSAVTCTTIKTKPQSLQIEKTDVLWLPIKWRADRETGKTILNSISYNHDDLRAILGGDEYLWVVHVLGMPAQGGAAPRSASRTVGVAAGSVSTNVAAGSSSVPLPTSSGPSVQIPAKRKLPIEDDDTIDLTTP